MKISVGDLVVRLTADPKPVQDGTDAAEKALRDWEAKSKAQADRINVYAKRALAAATVAATGFALAINKATENAADLAKASQGLGVPVEKLSQLKFAAEASGSSMEGLHKALVTLNKGLVATAGDGASPAVEALRAMGIAARGADGALRGSADVLEDVATKFAAYRDGAAKTALAVALFGEEGARLIPLLNGGAAGLDAMAKKSDALGLTIDQKAADASARFQKTLADIGRDSEGTANRITQWMLPALQRLADKFREVTAAANSDTEQGGVLGFIADKIEAVAPRAAERLRSIAERIDEVNGKTYEPVGPYLSEFTEQAEAAAKAVAKVNAPILGDKGDGWKAGTFTNFGDGGAQADADQSEAEALTESLREPLAALDEAREKYARFFADGRIDADTFAKANMQASAMAADAYLGAASNISGALAQLFGENKAFAIANALVNTAQGVTAALASAPPPINFANAAAVAAAGAAQIAAIRSASKGGGSKPAVGRGGSSGGATGGAAGAAAPRQSLFVQGINPDQIFTGDAVRNLVGKLIDYQKNGGAVVLAET